MSAARKRERKKDRKRRRAKEPSLAARADRHRLYESAVQAPEFDLDLVEKIFRDRRGRRPLLFREDFCGTALLSCEWVKGHRRRRALGVDLDRPTLEWAERHNLARLDDDARQRIELVHADVRDVTRPAADVTCAFNFSICIFKTRRELGDYLRRAWEGLAEEGMLFIELHGGTEALCELEEEREEDGFTYVWEQERFNPINHDFLAHIHFRFEDGSEIERAFTYDWRLWSIPEVRELLAEAGFRATTVFWDRAGEDDDSDYVALEEVENQEGWLVFIAAER